MATAAIKWSAEVACKLCRNAAVKTKGQWLTAYFGVPRGTILFVCARIPSNAYLPNFTSSTFTSAGETPGMRDAWPIVVGRMRLSFWRASIVSDCIAL